MIFIDLLSWIIFIFLVYYLIIQFYVISCSSKGRIIDIEKRNYTPKFEQNFTVVVYSHNNGANIINLIESLKKQNYDPEKYSINVILDNCSDNSAKLLEILGGTRLWRISTDVKPIGKNKAVGWLLERILSSENTNAFVVIEAESLIKPDFLSKINSEIFDKPIIIGEVSPLNNNNCLITNIVSFKNTLKNRVIKHGRFYAGLHNFLEGDVWAIRQEVLEKVNFTVTDYGFEEYEFSVKLSKSGFKIATSSQIVVYKNLSETIKTAALKKVKNRYKAFITLKNNIGSLFSFKRPIRTKELLLSLLYPSSTMIILAAFMLLAVSIFTDTLFSHYITYKHISCILLAYMLSKSFQLVAGRSKFGDYKNSILSMFYTPVIFISSIFFGLKSNFNFKFALPKAKLPSKDYSKQIIDTIVSDGKKELPCKIEIKQNEHNVQAAFVFKEKRLQSTKHKSIDTALYEISEKLKAHGFTLKICFNCKYFKLDSQTFAKFNGEQGCCIYDNVHNNSKAKEYTYIWNSCPDIVIKKAEPPKENEKEALQPEE